MDNRLGSTFGMERLYPFIDPLHSFTHPILHYLLITTLPETDSIAVVADFIQNDASYPPSVIAHFQPTTKRSTPKAVFHAYSKDRKVIHCVDMDERSRDMYTTVQDLSLHYATLFETFIDVLHSQALTHATLHFSPVGGDFFARHPSLQPHIALLSLSAIVLSFIRIPSERLKPLLRYGSMVLCAGRDTQLFSAVCQGKIGQLRKVGVEDALTMPMQLNGYKWISNSNTHEDCLNRLAAFFDTQIRVWSGGFRTSSSISVSIGATERMLAGTRTFSIEDAASFLQTRDNPHHATKFIRLDRQGPRDSVMEIAATRARAGFRVVAVNDASPYRCGGEVTSGGAHSAEEAWSVMSTLFRSLSQVSSSMPAALHMGCILSPSVELFRAPDSRGYAFLASAVELGVVSVGMFNKNPYLVDTPVDAPTDFDTYLGQMVRKILTVVAGAVYLGGDVLVLVDLGCGNFQNDPIHVGDICNVVLRETYGFFKEVILLGNSDFTTRALKELDASVYLLRASQELNFSATAIQSQWRGWQARARFEEMNKQETKVSIWRDRNATAIDAHARGNLARHPRRKSGAAKGRATSPSKTDALRLFSTNGMERKTRSNARPLLRGRTQVAFSTSTYKPRDKSTSLVRRADKDCTLSLSEDTSVPRVRDTTALLLDDAEIRERRYSIRRKEECHIFLNADQSCVLTFMRLFSMLKEWEAVAIIQSCVQSRPKVALAVNHCPFPDAPVPSATEFSTEEHILRRCIRLSRQIPDAMLAAVIVSLGSAQPALISTVRRVWRSFPSQERDPRFTRSHHATLFQEVANLIDDG